jgi:hypothetical protein
MSLFSYLKKRKKESDEIEQELLEQEIKDLPPEEKIRDIKEVCQICNKEIGSERYRKFQGKWYHKKCFKKGLKGVMNGG